MNHWAKDTVALTLTGSLSGVIAFLYRVVLSNSLGPLGMAEYEQTLALFYSVTVLMTSGISLSVSKLVAEKQHAQDRMQVVSSALALATGFSLLGMGFLAISFAFAASKALAAILPSVMFVSYSSVLKGYFYGMYRVRPVLLTDLGECVFRALLGLTLVRGFIFTEFQGETEGAVWALTVGELLSLGVLLVSYAKDIKVWVLRRNFVTKEAVASIVGTALPVSIGQVFNSLSTASVAFLIPKCLMASGMDSLQALSLYGKTSGMVLPLLFFPSAFVRVLSINVVPRIARAVSANTISRAHRLARQVITVCIVYSVLVTAFVMLSSSVISRVCFPGMNLGNLIRGFSLHLPFFCLESILTAILRGFGDNVTPVINSALKLVLESAVLVALIAKTSMGIYGYAAATVVSHLAAICVSLLRFKHKAGAC